MKLKFKDYLNYKWDKSEFMIGTRTGDTDQPVPRGRDWKTPELYLDHADELHNQKDQLCYCNFSLDTHDSRKKVYKVLKDKKCIYFDRMGKWMSPNKINDTYIQESIKFYEHLSKNKFIISPRGNGVDCFRTWDALYMKCIPIVPHDDSGIMERYSDLPILFTDDYTEINRKYLLNTYNKILETEYNFEKLFLSYWKKKYTDDELKKWLTL